MKYCCEAVAGDFPLPAKLMDAQRSSGTGIRDPARRRKNVPVEALSGNLEGVLA
jgi:hypothetical protein